MRFEAVADVAGSIGHDLNNVLTVIRAAATFLRDGMGTTSPQRDDVEAIERATDRAEWLTRRLLAAGRRPAPQHAGVDLLQLVRAACEAASADVLAPLDVAVTLQLDPSSTAQMVAVDPMRVRDVVDTMLRMARAGGGSASVPGPLWLRTGPAAGDEGLAELALQYSSHVIDAELAARLAAPNFEPERHGGDHELALAVLHTLLRQTGGRLRVDVSSPESNIGSTVRAQWPVVSEPLTEMPALAAEEVEVVAAPAIAADEATAPATDSDAPAEATPAPRRQGGVLLVDDDARLRDLGRRMFERAGDAVYTAATGREALTFLDARADEVALVVTDLTMPDLGGLDLIDVMATRYPDIPVMAISGYGVAPGTQERLAMRHVPYVQKPFTMDVLLDAASRVRASWPGS
jgi:CheY-like chemotaxis protein